jgi:hypothetical protein
MELKKTVYEPHCVLFLDILGFRDLINKNMETLVFELMQGVQKRVAEINGKNSYTKMTAFSDSIVLSMSAKADWHVISTIARLASLLQLLFIREGVMTRGGIAIGSLHHEDHVVFGPALNEAYELESEIAIYPRVVISDEAYDRMIAHEVDALTSIIGDDAFAATDYGGTKELFREDFDGIRHVDIFSPYAATPSSRLRPGVAYTEFDEELRADYLQTKYVMAILANAPERTHKNAKIIAKYDWLGNYHDECMDEDE